MARRRDLKPEYFKDKRMGALGSQVGTVYQALWCLADDGGVSRADPDLIKGEMLARWPEYTLAVLMTCLQKLSDSGRIRLYAVGDDLYAELPTLGKHNTISHPSKFRFPRGGERVTSIHDYVSGQLSLAKSPGTLPEPSTSSSQIQVPDPKPVKAAAAGVPYLVRCVQALNAGLLSNPRIPAPREVAASTQAGLVEWETLGLPVEVVVKVVEQKAASYVPTPGNTQPRSLKYFDAAVKEACEKVSQGNGVRHKVPGDWASLERELAGGAS